MKKLIPKVWLIDPVKQSVTQIDTPDIPSLIAETVGEGGDCYKLDNSGNVVWMSDADSNSRYAYFWEGMPYPFDVRRYSGCASLVGEIPVRPYWYRLNEGSIEFPRPW